MWRCPNNNVMRWCRIVRERSVGGLAWLPWVRQILLGIRARRDGIPWVPKCLVDRTLYICIATWVDDGCRLGLIYRCRSAGWNIRWWWWCLCLLDLQIYKSAGRSPAKAMQHLKAYLGTRFLTNREQETGNEKAKVHRTNTNSFSQYSDKLHLDAR